MRPSAVGVRGMQRHLQNILCPPPPPSVTWLSGALFGSVVWLLVRLLLLLFFDLLFASVRIKYNCSQATISTHTHTHPHTRPPPPTHCVATYVFMFVLCVCFCLCCITFNAFKQLADPAGRKDSWTGYLKCNDGLRAVRLSDYLLMGVAHILCAQIGIGISTKLA